MTLRVLLLKIFLASFLWVSPGIPGVKSRGDATAGASGNGRTDTQSPQSVQERIEVGNQLAECASVLTTLGIPGALEVTAEAHSVLYVDSELWHSRRESLERFLQSHLDSPRWWPLQVRSKKRSGGSSEASERLQVAASLLTTELEQSLRSVILVSGNSVARDELAWLREDFPETEGWSEYHWTIVEPSNDIATESRNTELVMFCRKGESPVITADRWDLARHLNPFAQPARTTDYYGSGDINLDGTFDSSDVAHAQAIVAGTEPLTERADVDGDGAVGSQDVETMQEVLSGSRAYLPGWWDRLETHEERDDWISRMLVIDKTDQHTYQPGYFVCVHFASVLVLNSTDYDGVFFGEPSKWITQGRFNLPMCHVSLSGVAFHSITGILVGDNPLDFDSWRFIEPQNDSDARSWFQPGERIRVMAVESFSTPGGLKGRDLVVFQLDEEKRPVVDYADPDLVTERLCGVTVTPEEPSPGQTVHVTVRASSEDIQQLHVRIRFQGDEQEVARMAALYDDGLHNDGAANDGVWGGSTSIEEQGNVILDVVAGLTGGGETTYQQATWFRTAEKRWHVSPVGLDSNPGTVSEPFRTFGRAIRVAFPGDKINISPGVYDELAIVTKGGLRISRDADLPGDVSLREMHIRYGTGLHIEGISFQYCKVFSSEDPVLEFCSIESLFSSFSGGYPKLRNCRTKELRSQNSALRLFGCLASNPEGTAVTIMCPRTTEPALVPFQISNCTIVNSDVGFHCSSDEQDPAYNLRITNSILWGNAADITSDYPQIDPVRCNIESGWSGGEDNISLDPRFVNAAGGDFRLGAGSPCIDTGTNEEWMWDEVDLDGNPRICRGETSWTVDMGAYEHGSFPFEVIEIARIEGTTLTWRSHPGDSYTIWTTGDPSDERSWSPEAAVSSGGHTTTWADLDTTSTRKFYRIGIE